MTKYDWTKLDNGWMRQEDDEHPGIHKGGVDVYDDGEVLIEPDARDAGCTPEHTLELLTEAVAQRKQCEVREPKFAFGDWVTYQHSPAPTRIVTRPKLNWDGRYCYGALRYDCDAVRGETLLYLYEDVLTPCDPPGDGGGE